MSEFDEKACEECYADGFRAMYAEVAPLVEALELYANDEHWKEHVWNCTEEKDWFGYDRARRALSQWRGTE